MDVLEAIRTRRTIGKVKPDPVDRGLIERLLEAATWAPSHHGTEPWRFFILTGNGRRSLGRTLADIVRVSMADPTTPENEARVRIEEAKAFRAPVVIVVAVQPSDKPGVVRQEEVEAGAAAIQNMLLAAHALGLGAVWRTGSQAYHPKMRELFGLHQEDEVLGFIYIGYPDLEPPPRRRVPYQEKTTWVDTDSTSEGRGGV